jgi:hypothetical protein
LIKLSFLADNTFDITIQKPRLMKILKRVIAAAEKKEEMKRQVQSFKKSLGRR